MSELIQMLRNWIGIHLDVRILFLMARKVNLEISFCSETISTNIAFVRTLTYNKYPNHCHKQRENKELCVP